MEENKELETVTESQRNAGKGLFLSGIIITLRALVCIFRSQVRTAGDKITVFQLVSAIGGRQYKLMLCREKPPAALQWGKKGAQL